MEWMTQVKTKKTWPAHTAVLNRSNLLKAGLIRVLIIIVLLTVYSYRYELNGIKDRVFSELMPTKGYNQTINSVSFPAASDGHFYIQAEVNGVPILFLADTGASGIVLSPADAEKIGFRISDLNFNKVFLTANGKVRGSSVKLNSLKISGIHLKDVKASVNEAKMRESLLGMTFFRRLKSYEVRNNTLTFYWK